MLSKDCFSSGRALYQQINFIVKLCQSSLLYNLILKYDTDGSGKILMDKTAALSVLFLISKTFEIKYRCISMSSLLSHCLGILCQNISRSLQARAGS